MLPLIRQEKPTDHPIVFQLIEAAFKDMPYTDHREQFLVTHLRQAAAFVPELSLVAEWEGKLVGHILLTKIQIINPQATFDSLALAPVSVLPAFQNKGIGSALIKAAHNKARTLGFRSVVVLGHPEYYPRFGYIPAHQFGISLPFDVPKENCMAVELVEDGLLGVSGEVKYAEAFYD